MLRRQARLRREFLYGKSKEHKQAAILEKKKQVKISLEENKLLPTTVRDEALKFQDSLEWEDNTENFTTHEDNEYRWAGVEDPKIVITTSHDPSVKLKQFAKELRLVFPNAQRMNRGNYDLKHLIDACRANDVTDFIIIHETRGKPDSLIISHLPHGPTARFTIVNTIMRHDIENVGTMPQEYPHLVFHNFKTKLGQRVVNILKHLFPVPKEESKRVVSFLNHDDFIIFRHHQYYKEDNKVQIRELGPRFELKLYEIKLGTLDQDAVADTEWSLRPYTNTARKQRFISKDPM
ncbi:U3 small nucleolar ribonucleoprotein protein IMP4-like [Stegodyphus dumicola]|uniref:U3 small nucleolar ribonucleoprotein protein IMP4-like n=1 Tax=Stegodyphus dumicola TaxID=202533 RepID=UPI0015A7EFC3|nr:U3 small nucleolar ribonucleoprotein protein IMP4-like [Stegodyphus dumicola]